MNNSSSNMSLLFRAEGDAALEETTLVLGGGIGWTGALALDLLINTLALERNGVFLSSVSDLIVCHDKRDHIVLILASTLSSFICL
jgi:hypothetical protein